MKNRKYNYSVDPFADTQPSLGSVRGSSAKIRRAPDQKVKMRNIGRWYVILIGIFLLISIIYFGFPPRTNVLILGVDDRQENGVLGRTDTMILVTFIPTSGKVSMLSIPRDLWVSIPEYGHNRINTAHFFAEAAQAGTGLFAAKQVVEENFRVDVPYAVRVNFKELGQIVDLIGGIEIELDQPVSGYLAGKHILNSEQALAFVRDRSGADDFSRMANSQIFLRSIVKELVKPSNFVRLPPILIMGTQVVTTDIPFYLWPRLALPIIRSGPEGIRTESISRDMVIPFTTDGGAQVLAPNWENINPLVEEIFGG